jgi:hypothetical protein
MTKEPKILVLGSLAWEVALVPDKGSSFDRHCAWVGAPIIRKMIREALVEVDCAPSDPTKDEAVKKAIGEIELRLEPTAPLDNFLEKERCEITTVFKSFPKKSAVAKKPDSVLRVHENYTSLSTGTANLLDDLTRTLASTTDPDILVVYDQDPRFHEALESAVKQTSISHRPVLIIALAETIHEESLAAIRQKLSARTDTVVVVTATGLRKHGLNIVEYGSIEQTVREVFEYSTTQPLETILQESDHLIILFEETGAIYIRRENETLRGSIHFCPNFDRIAQMDYEVYGRSPGRVAIALASVVRQVNAQMKAQTPLDLTPAVRLAVAAYNVHFALGFDRSNPFSTMEKALSYDRRCDLKSRLENQDRDKRDKEFFVSSLDFPVKDTLKRWTRLDAVLPATKPEDLKKVLHHIVTNGPEEAFREREDVTKSPPVAATPWFPASVITCPYLEVGRIKTFDADEIAGFAALARLIRKYLRDEKWATPLSIAVFGEPGSGKSFSVKELLKSINPATPAALTFNLAQFDSVALLTEAFHQVQDRALSSDAVPLVIFDEFDSNFEGKLGWLKYFLAPMQDGSFRGQSGEYRVGRAIFLFAGGTSTTFKEFKEQVLLPEQATFSTAHDQAEPNRKDSAREEQIRKEAVALRDAKLTDFVSRLKGFLDVMGLNPPDDKQSAQTPEEPHKTIERKVRRAVVLRSLLVEFAKPIMTPGDDGRDDVANIEDDVIDAFLNVPKYEHGVRSMESVVRMSRWIDGRLIKASLPALSQLDMHAPRFWDTTAPLASGASSEAKPKQLIS